MPAARTDRITGNELTKVLRLKPAEVSDYLAAFKRIIAGAERIGPRAIERLYEIFALLDVDRRQRRSQLKALFGRDIQDHMRWPGGGRKLLKLSLAKDVLSAVGNDGSIAPIAALVRKGLRLSSQEIDLLCAWVAYENEVIARISQRRPQCPADLPTALFKEAKKIGVEIDVFFLTGTGIGFKAAASKVPGTSNPNPLHVALGASAKSAVMVTRALGGPLTKGALRGILPGVGNDPNVLMKSLQPFIDQMRIFGRRKVSFLEEDSELLRRFHIANSRETREREQRAARDFDLAAASDRFLFSKPGELNPMIPPMPPWRPEKVLRWAASFANADLEDMTEAEQSEVAEAFCLIAKGRMVDTPSRPDTPSLHREIRGMFQILGAGSQVSLSPRYRALADSGLFYRRPGLERFGSSSGGAFLHGRLAYEERLHRRPGRVIAERMPWDTRTAILDWISGAAVRSSELLDIRKCPVCGRYFVARASKARQAKIERELRMFCPDSKLCAWRAQEFFRDRAARNEKRQRKYKEKVLAAGRAALAQRTT